jgi:hypothetical protein
VVDPEQMLGPVVPGTDDHDVTRGNNAITIRMNKPNRQLIASSRNRVSIMVSPPCSEDSNNCHEGQGRVGACPQPDQRRQDSLGGWL